MIELAPDLRLVGTVERATPTVVRLVPLLKWYGSSEPHMVGNQLDNFPTRGRVTWFHPPPVVPLWSLCVFNIRENANYDPADRNKPDQYMVDSTPPSLVEDVVIASFPDEEQARKALTAGIALSFAPPKRAYVRVGDNHLIGPIVLSPRPNGIYAFPADGPHSQLSVFKLGDDDVVDVAFEQLSWSFLWPIGQRKPEVGEVDWGPPRDVVRRALKVLARQGVGASEDVQLTDRLMRRLSDSVGDAGLTALEKHRLQRATKEIAASSVSLQQVTNLRDDTLAVPAVKELLQKERDTAAEEARKAALGAANQELERLRGEAKKLASDFEHLTAERKTLESEIAGLREKQSSIAKTLEPEVAAAVERVVSAPATVLSDLLVLEPFVREILGPSAAGALPKTIDSLAAAPTPAIADVASSAPTIQETQLSGHLRAVAMEAGVEPGVTRRIFSALLAGTVPCIVGDRSAAVAQAFATWIFNGEAFIINLHPGILAPEQLVSNSGAFQEFIARGSSSVRLVVLEGVNRTLADSAVLPLVQASKPGNAAAHAFGKWPDHLLVIATASSSELELRLTQPFWNASAFVYADLPENYPPSEEEATPGCLATSTFSSLKSIATPPGNWRHWTDKHAPWLNLSRAVQKEADRLEQGMRKSGADSTEAAAAALEAFVLPLLLQTPPAMHRKVLDFPGFKDQLETAFKYLNSMER